MKYEKIKVLLIDDDDDDFVLTRDLLSAAKIGEYTLDWADSYEEGLQVAERGEHHVCLVDYRLGERTGVELIREARESRLTTPMILLTGQGDHDIDVEAMRAGATDYLVKDETPPARLERTIRYAVQLNTERSRAEAVLRDSEMKFRSVAQSANDAIIAADSAGRIISWNNGAQHIFGYSETEVPGISLAQLLPEVYRSAYQSWMEHHGTTGESHLMGNTIELNGLRKNGSEFPLELSLSTWVNGAERFYCGIIRDITERRRADAESRSAEQRYRLLVEATTAIVWNTPASGEFQTEQPGWSAFTGQNYEQLQGWGWLDAVHPEDQPETRRIWSAAVARRSIYEVEHRLRRHDGTFHYMMVRAAPILAEDGTIREWIGVHTDITERKQFELALAEARDAALESARLKSEFLANMSHEIRTPMNGVIGMAGLLLGTNLDARQRNFADIICSSGDALLIIINDILDFSMIEAGKLNFENIDFDLHGVVEGTVEILAERAQAKNLELISLIESNMLTGLRGDPGRVRQVLTNLLGNALKFTEHGEVVLRASKDSETSSHVFVRFAVSDTGIGIDEAGQHRLFQAFTQGDGSTTRKYGGTGLGLAISKQLVEMMGGEIGVESIVGQGSTFWFTIKFEKQPERSPTTASPAEAYLEGIRVLVVDDSALSRQILLHQTSAWGMRPQAAGDGLQALEQLRLAAAQGHPYEIVITGMLMPGLDSMQLSHAIKAEAALADAKIILLSPFGHSGQEGEASGAGIDACLSKPVKQSQLCNCLIKLVAETRNLTFAPQILSTATRHSPAEPLPHASRKMILLAEDNVINQKVALRLLQKLGYTAIDVVPDGREAVAAIETTDYDVILMDCQMPSMDGYEATAAIRARETGGRRVPIIALTAHALEDERAKCLAAGMDDYISKPVKLEELERVVANWANVSSPTPEEVGIA